MAEENTQAQTAQQPEPAPDNKPEQNAKLEAPEKKFTQQELDDIVKERLQRERKGQPSKEELEAFRKWQESQKTAEQKQAERETKLTERETALEQRERQTKAKELLAEKGVPAALLAAVDVSSEEAIAPSVETIAKAFTDAVSEAVTKQLAAAPPKAGAKTKTDPFLEGLGD